MSQDFLSYLANEINHLKLSGLYKGERVITSQQQAEITTNGAEVLNFCANNYLGLANHPALITAAKEAIEEFFAGFKRNLLSDWLCTESSVNEIHGQNQNVALYGAENDK